MSWTKFHDNHSGGGLKTAYEEIFIELPEAKAIDFFDDYFDFYPVGITCQCCGLDYEITTIKKLPSRIRKTKDLVITIEDIREKQKAA